MQITCPRCRIPLEIPESAANADAFLIECGACQNRFRLQLNRPSLKVSERHLRPKENRAAGAGGTATQVALGAAPPLNPTASSASSGAYAASNDNWPSNADLIPEAIPAEQIVLTAESHVEGRRIGQQLGPIFSTSPLVGINIAREIAMLQALSKVQRSLRLKAQQLGAGAVVRLKLETAGLPDEPILKLQGTAVRFFPLVS